MRALLPDSSGSSASVVLGEAAEPQPAADEAIVAVEAFSVNRGETLQLKGALACTWPGWRPGKDAAGRKLGASQVVTDVEKAQGPFDLVLESVGGGSLPLALARLATGGLLLWFGQAGGQPVTLDFFSFLGGPSEARIRHFDYTRSALTHGQDLATLVRLVADGRLHPEIDEVRDWSRTAEAVADLRGRRIRGNAVLTLGTD